MSDEGKCRSCGVLVVWCKLLPSCKPHPLNAVPVVGGNIETRPGEIAGERYGKVVPATERGDRRLYTSHFMSCAQAASWRRKA